MGARHRCERCNEINDTTLFFPPAFGVFHWLACLALIVLLALFFILFYFTLLDSPHIWRKVSVQDTIHLELSITVAPFALLTSSADEDLMFSVERDGDNEKTEQVSWYV